MKLTSTRILLLASAALFAASVLEALSLEWELLPDFDEMSSHETWLAFTPVGVILALCIGFLFAAASTVRLKAVRTPHPAQRIIGRFGAIATSAWFLVSGGYYYHIASAYAQLNYRVSWTTHEGLISAARRGDLPAVANYLNRGANPNSTDWEETPETVLTTAIKAHQPRIVELLLSRGADVEKYGGNESPLANAAECRDPAIGKILLDRGARVDGTHGGEDMTALAIAESNGDRKFTELLLQRGADQKLVDKYNRDTAQIQAENAKWYAEHGG